MTKLLPTNEVSPFSPQNKPALDDSLKTSPNKKAPDEDQSSVNGRESYGNGFLRILSDYGDKASLNGVVFIKTARSPIVRAVWAFLLLAAVGAMTYHLYTLFAKYFDYKKHTQINIGFSTLNFPAVTVCNVNIMRKNERSKVSLEILNLLDEVDYETLKSQAISFDPDYDDVDYDDDEEESDSDTNNSNSTKVQTVTFFDDFNISAALNYVRYTVEDNYYNEFCKGTWEAESNASSSSAAEDIFRDMFSKLPKKTREEVGHQLDDMLMKCSFAGRKCILANFKRRHSTNYGNCYTLENDKFISRKSGPSGGLEMILYLETNEYLEGITSGKGAQVVIHELGTLPFPDDEGIAVTAGEQTMIGLRQMQITRLDGVYGPCKSVDDFMQKYKIKYTRNTCLKICQQNLIMETCHCYDEIYQDINDVMKISDKDTPCQNASQITCVTRVKWRFDDNASSCACDSPCSEKVYGRNVASRMWPSDSVASLMVESMRTTKKDLAVSTDVQEDFIKLNIYFEELNFEELEEQIDYEFTQLMSDVGGTIGLWIGLSILSMFELFHVLLQICHYIVRGNR
ncbi:unnamed protein product [Lymnaea stagnalis]|uniref:Uncharacterized protein n=1 Tax=Lymnaea stagnalis TaxID=6523 RepID=A0AAV2I3C7_LYMST